MKTYKHLMIDLETMGNDSFSSVISLGAIEFDIDTAETGKSFYANISLQSCLDAGLIVNASTIMWWMMQNEQARKDLVQTPSISIQEALIQFSAFCNKDYEVWGNSARFDCGLLQNAYQKIGMDTPWDFRKERCVRTLVSFNPEIKKNFPMSGTSHNALSDCIFQVGYCSAIWNSMKAGK
jgi:hypothetical protein